MGDRRGEADVGKAQRAQWRRQALGNCPGSTALCNVSRSAYDTVPNGRIGISLEMTNGNPLVLPRSTFWAEPAKHAAQPISGLSLSLALPFTLCALHLFPLGSRPHSPAFPRMSWLLGSCRLVAWSLGRQLLPR